MYGTRATVELIEEVGVSWHDRYPDGPVLLIGDISKKGGGRLPPHKSHDKGLDFDVQNIRTDSYDDQERQAEVGKPLYDRARTQELVDIIRALAGGRLDFILSKDKGLTGIKRQEDHRFHLHVRVRPER
jgi:murein endopeptidase